MDQITRLPAMNELENKTAIITGASKGIGRATALRLAKSGADVAINYLTSESEAIDVAREIESLGRQSLVVKADVAEPDDLESMVEYVGEQFGRIDIIVSNAAGGGFRNILDAQPSNFDSAMRINARPIMVMAKSAIPFMNNDDSNGKIIGVSSHGSDRALPAYGLIGASKAALESLVRHLALEIGPRGINCNCVLSGLVRTDSTRYVADSEKMFQDARKQMLVNENRELQPNDVAEAIHFLASPASDLIQGQTLVIDGGSSIRG